jgi:hypothetical protein
MEEVLRREQIPQFIYNGNLLSAIVYYKGTTSIAHSFDIVSQGRNLSKIRQDQKDMGLTDEDMRKVEAYVQGLIDAKEGRR